MVNEDFFKKYDETLNDLNYKVVFFKNLFEDAYSEITRILPKINSELKELIKDIKDIIEATKEAGLDLNESKDISLVTNGIMSIPDAILEIMASLQVQDSVMQCISHIVSAIKITREFVGSTDSGLNSTDGFKLLKFLSIMSTLLKVQLENIYTKMDNNLCYIPVKFKEIFLTLRPQITLEELLEGGTEQSIMMDLHDEINKIISKGDGFSQELKTKLERSAERILDLDEKIPDITNDIDSATAVPRKLEQPLAELLFLNHSLEKASKDADTLLRSMFDGNKEEIDCSDKLREIANLFSTKGEIEIARSIITDIQIEESGEEGGLVLF